MYQNTFEQIGFFFFLHFPRAIDVIISYLICDNTKENFLWEPEKRNVKFHKMTSNT